MTADTQAQGDLIALAEKCGAYISTFQFDDSRVRGVSLTADQLQAFAAALQGTQEGEPNDAEYHHLGLLLIEGADAYAEFDEKKMIEIINKIRTT